MWNSSNHNHRSSDVLCKASGVSDRVFRIDLWTLKIDRSADWGIGADLDINSARVVPKMNNKSKARLDRWKLGWMSDHQTYSLPQNVTQAAKYAPINFKCVNSASLFTCVNGV